MNEKVVFSISTSFYKRSDWVEHIYNSLKRQTYPLWEWVVTDDFSEELNAEEQLKTIASKDPRVRYYPQTRKKELFYNPNYGCSGNVVVQLDSDDTIYDNLLEIYVKYFESDPELMGVTCGHIMKKELVEFVSISAYPLAEANNIQFAPMARAWRNTIPFFDRDGELNGFQNDTNIWRQVEVRGKVMFIPRELYNYNYSGDSLSKVKTTREEIIKIENERLWIEGRFPSLMDDNKCTFDLKYLPIDRLSWAFYSADFNQSISRKNVLFIKSDIKPFEKQLVNELFYDHTINYNVDDSKSYDEIIAYLNVDTYEFLVVNMPKLRHMFSGVTFRFFIDSEVWDCELSCLNEVFGEWSFWESGGLHYGHLVL
jgi:glycosyltransferase involved in cell wall biosynthesis